MAKTHSWAPRAPDILARVAASSRQSWRRIVPPAIQFEPGSLVITGADSAEILEHLCLLAQALQNDLATIQTMLDPPPQTPSVEQDELRAMFARLREDEHAWQLARSQANAADSAESSPPR
jgi:hypothetical protein